MNKTQKIVAELMKVSSFNNFDGKKVVKNLEESNKWIGFIWGRLNCFELIPLRDIQNDLYNADTLYITVRKRNLDWIKEMVKNWKVNEFGYYMNGEKIGVYNRIIDEIETTLGATPEEDIAYCRLWWD